MIAVARTRYVYYPETQAVPSSAGPRLLNRPHSIEADVEIPNGGAEGVLLAVGGSDAGFVFYVKGGKLIYAQNYVMLAVYSVESKESVPAGQHKLRFEFEPTGKPDLANGKGAPGNARLYIDGSPAGQAEFPVTVPLALGLSGGFQVGRNAGSPVVDDYDLPFAFTGKIYDVTVDVSGDLIADHEAEAKMILARQ